MHVVTSVRIGTSAERVWPLLTGATLPLPRPFCFRVGIPTPVECRLPSGSGGVGAERECVTDRGRIRQRITVWDPPRILAFERVEDTLGLDRLLTSLRDTFTLEPLEGGVRLTRTSEGTFAAGVGPFRRWAVARSVRSIHRHVHANFKALAEAPG